MSERSRGSENPARGNENPAGGMPGELEILERMKALVESGEWPRRPPTAELAARYRAEASKRRAQARRRRTIRVGAAAATIAMVAVGAQQLQSRRVHIETVDNTTIAAPAGGGQTTAGGWTEISTPDELPDVAQRADLASTVLADGRVVLWGGRDVPANSSSAETEEPSLAYSDGVILDPQTKALEAIPAGGIAVEATSATPEAIAADDKVLVFDRTGETFQTAVYDATARAWNDPSNSPPNWSPTSQKSAALGFDGKVVAVVDPGLAEADATDANPEVWRRPIDDSGWSAGASPPGGTYVGQAVASPDASHIAFPLGKQDALSIAIYSVSEDSWTTSSLADFDGLDTLGEFDPALTRLAWTSNSTIFLELGRRSRGMIGWSLIGIDLTTGRVRPTSTAFGVQIPEGSEAANSLSVTPQVWNWEQRGGVLVSAPEVGYGGGQNNVFVSGTQWLTSALGPPLAADWGFVSTSAATADPGTQAFEVAVRPYGSDWLPAQQAPFANRSGPAVVVSGGYVVVTGGMSTNANDDRLWVLSLADTLVDEGRRAAPHT